MHMTVDETGVDGVPRRIDRLIAIQRRTDVDDPVAFDDDVGNRCGAVVAVENLSALDHRASHIGAC